MRTLIVGVVLLLAGCGHSDGPATATAPTAPSLATFVVQPTSVAAETAYDGVVEAVNQSTVSAQTSGRVTELPYDVGDFVEKNAVIVRFTDTEQRARSNSGEAALAEARARLAEAQQTFDRTRVTYERQLVAKAQLDKAAADLNSAKARTGAAQAALDESRVGFDRTVIRAPYAGIVVTRLVQLGETVTPGKPLMTGLSLEHLRVVVDVPQQHIGPLRLHKKARVILPDGRSVDVANLRLPPSADPATHTFRILAALPEGDYGVFPGTLVKVAFVSGQGEALLVPGSAVVQRSEVSGVYVVDPEQRLGLRYVRLGEAGSDGRVAILSGLSAGERVASDPVAATQVLMGRSGDP